jgi:hypothetical protein
MRRHLEFAYSAVAIAAVTALYVVAVRREGRFPVPSSLVGHGIGIVGFTLMLMTATLYTIRKRQTVGAWGGMESWLRFHMVTGLVGPYMVLLHTSFRFLGLAGVATLLTTVVVISGLVGRYIYTLIPRVARDDEPDALDRLIGRYERSGMPDADLAMASSGPREASLGGGGDARAMTPTQAPPPDRRQERLEARRSALATWRSIHLPLTWALFVAAAIHMIGALYYELGR